MACKKYINAVYATALLVGVAKEAFEVGEIGEDLEIIHSTLETLVAVIQVQCMLLLSLPSNKHTVHYQCPTQLLLIVNAFSYFFINILSLLSLSSKYKIGQRVSRLFPFTA